MKIYPWTRRKFFAKESIPHTRWTTRVNLTLISQRYRPLFRIKADLRNVQTPKEEQPALDASALIEQLQKSPELLQTLSQLIGAKVRETKHRSEHTLILQLAKIKIS